MNFISPLESLASLPATDTAIPCPTGSVGTGFVGGCTADAASGFHGTVHPSTKSPYYTGLEICTAQKGCGTSSTSCSSTPGITDKLSCLAMSTTKPGISLDGDKVIGTCIAGSRLLVLCSKFLLII